MIKGTGKSFQSRNPRVEQEVWKTHEEKRKLNGFKRFLVARKLCGNFWFRSWWERRLRCVCRPSDQSYFGWLFAIVFMFMVSFYRLPPQIHRQNQTQTDARISQSSALRIVPRNYANCLRDTFTITILCTALNAGARFSAFKLRVFLCFCQFEFMKFQFDWMHRSH